MATVAEKSADLAVPDWAPSHAVDEKVDRYLASRLKAVGADYRSVAITTFLLASAIGMVLWLGAGVIADHWLVPGGLGRTLRIAWLAVGAAGLLAAAIKWVVPLVVYRVNLVYAARSIERANPELRNDVVNTVLVRAHPERISPVVVTSLEHRTAKRLSKLPADVVTDRGPALRLAMALAILVALACVYAVLSPKSLGTSLARLVAPWSRVAPPTRVQIGEPEFGWRLPASERGGGEAFHPIPLEDGRATIIRNRQLIVRSRIRGMASGEEPTVEALGIAEDGTIDRASGWRSRMEPAGPHGEGGFVATLPGGGHGLSNDLVVSVTAGDARSEPVRIVVVDAPSLLVKQLKLVPPAYTRREPEILEWQGDVSGLEGTKVTLLAESKDPLEMASIDFGCDGHGFLKLRIDPRDLARASGSFDLRLSADRSGPWERNYQLVFRPRGSPDGDGMERGIEHRINVVADTMPEVRVVEPGKPVVKVPPEKPVAVGVEAVDPDFALKSVAIELELERNGERMPRPAQVILDREFAGPFGGQAVFKPASVGGQSGDRLHYRAVAVDTKTPSPNAARTEWFTFELDAGAAPRPVPPSGREGNDQQGSGEGQGDASKGSEGGNGGGKGASNSGQANSGQGGGKQNGGGETQGSSEQPQQGTGERGSGPPEKGSQGERSQGAGGSADGSSQESQQASGSGGSDSSGSNSSGSESNEKSNAGSQAGSKGSRGDGADDRGEGQQAEGQKNGQQREGGQGGGEQANGNRPDSRKQTAENADGSGEPTEEHAQGSGGAGQGDQRQGKQQPSQNGDGERSDGKRSGADRPVASDGTNDGEAIERILQNKSQDGVAEEKEKGSKNEKNGAGEKNQAQSSAEQRPGDPSGESGECRPEEGKPCGNKECSKCQGGGREGGSSGGGGGQGGGDQKGNGQKGNGTKDGGQQGSGEQAAGNQGRGQQPGGAGQDGGSSGGSSSGNDDRTKDGSKKPGSGESGAGQPADNGGETAVQPGGDDQKSSGGTSKRADSKNAGNPKTGGKKEGNPSADRDAGGKRGERDGEGDSAQGSPSPNQKSGDGKSGGGKPGDSDVGRPGEDLANDDAASDRKPSEQAGAGGRAGRGFGGWDAGEEGKRAEGEAASKEADWGEENLAHARNAVDLAVEHLKRSMDEGRSDVLDSLGWTREQAQAFLDRWTRMAQSAKEGGPRKQQDFDRAVRSLGLTPSGVRRSRETVEDSRGGQAEGRRSQPPPDYREQFRAYTQGLRSDGG